jgi:hypothetical protein
VGDQNAAQFERIEREIVLEGILLAVRFPLPIGDDGTRIAPIGEFIQVRPERAEARLQIARIAPREVANRANSQLMHAREGHPADAP